MPRPKNPAALSGGKKEYNAQVLRNILLGDDDSDRINLALLNAGAGLYLAEKAPTIRDGVARARELIASGKATEKLELFIKKTNELGPGD